ncbi:hypothetical protein ACS0TY_036536 [Phlomoides rotata]
MAIEEAVESRMTRWWAEAIEAVGRDNRYSKRHDDMQRLSHDGRNSPIGGGGVCFQIRGTNNLGREKKHYTNLNWAQKLAQQPNFRTEYFPGNRTRDRRDRSSDATWRSTIGAQDRTATLLGFKKHLFYARPCVETGKKGVTTLNPIQITYICDLFPFLIGVFRFKLYRKYSRDPDNQTKSCKARGADLRVNFKSCESCDVMYSLHPTSV